MKGKLKRSAVLSSCDRLNASDFRSAAAAFLTPSYSHHLQVRLASHLSNIVDNIPGFASTLDLPQAHAIVKPRLPLMSKVPLWKLTPKHMVSGFVWSLKELEERGEQEYKCVTATRARHPRTGSTQAARRDQSPRPNDSHGQCRYHDAALSRVQRAWGTT